MRSSPGRMRLATRKGRIQQSEIIGFSAEADTGRAVQPCRGIDAMARCLGDGDAVGAADRRQAVGDDQCGTAFGGCGQRPPDFPFHLGVERMSPC